MSRNAKTLSIFSALPQSGSSSLVLLTGHYLASKNGNRCAVIDLNFSPSKTFVSSPPSPKPRAFHHLLPYVDQLQDETLEHFFTVLENGLRYIPFTQNENPAETSRALKILSPFFDYIILDWGPAHSATAPTAMNVSPKNIILSSLENKSVIALKALEKTMLSHQLPMSAYLALFNQTQPTQPLLKDFSNWSSLLTFGGTMPHQGNSFETDLTRAPIAPLLDKPEIKLLLTTIENYLGSNPQQPSVLFKINDSHSPQSHSLQVHLLHQKLLEALQAEGQGDSIRDGGVLRRDLLEPKAQEILNRLIQDYKIQDQQQVRSLLRETLDLCFGLGPLEPLLADSGITEIMVNGPNRVFIERNGLLEETNVRFHDEQQLRTILERILAPLGRRVDESQPMVDGRLPDGSRINAVLPPLSLNGPLLTIRKFSRRKLTVEDLIRTGSITRDAADFLGACVRAKKNILVSGGTGSGKTTLLNVLSAFIPERERIVTIEDSAELQLSQPHVVRLESRPANLEGKGQVSIRDLVINALRMRPDRIIVGEVRGREALDMLQAMNTGHDGSLTTGHANSPRDMLSRLETMCLFTGLNLPVQAIREQIARAVHLVVQQSRLPNGQRGVVHICEINGMEGNVFLLQDLFVKEEQGAGLTRKPFAPKFIEDLEAVGYRWPGHQSP